MLALIFPILLSDSDYTLRVEKMYCMKGRKHAKGKRTLVGYKVAPRTCFTSNCWTLRTLFGKKVFADVI